MIEKAVVVNQRLLEVLPQGSALDKTHAPHVTTLQRYVKTMDLDNVYAAVGKVLAEENLAAWELDGVQVLR